MEQIDLMLLFLQKRHTKLLPFIPSVMVVKVVRIVQNHVTGVPDALATLGFHVFMKLTALLEKYESKLCLMTNQNRLI